MDKETKKELHQEFQVERMIIFSDAVFAIVITLMAIEIQLPELDTGHYTYELFIKAMRHLFPAIVAYCATFFFIGVIWYQHLRLFSAVKAFNKGLVIRNLMLLFCVGFFPFSASIINKVSAAQTMVPMMIYIFVIIACLIAQVNLQYYVLYKKPELRNDMDVTTLKFDFKKKRAGLFAFLGVLAVYFILAISFRDSRYFFIAPMSFVLTPLFMWIFGAYKKY